MADNVSRISVGLGIDLSDLQGDLARGKSLIDGFAEDLKKTLSDGMSLRSGIGSPSSSAPGLGADWWKSHTAGLQQQIKQDTAEAKRLVGEFANAMRPVPDGNVAAGTGLDRYTDMVRARNRDFGVDSRNLQEEFAARNAMSIVFDQREQQRTASRVDREYRQRESRERSLDAMRSQTFASGRGIVGPELAGSGSRTPTAGMLVAPIAYGIQDALSQYGTRGLGGALNAAANNVQMMGAAFGPYGLAVSSGFGIAMQAAGSYLEYLDRVKAKQKEVVDQTESMFVSRFKRVVDEGVFQIGLDRERAGGFGGKDAQGMREEANRIRGGRDDALSEVALREREQRKLFLDSLTQQIENAMGKAAMKEGGAGDWWNFTTGEKTARSRIEAMGEMLRTQIPNIAQRGNAEELADFLQKNKELIGDMSDITKRIIGDNASKIAELNKAIQKDIAKVQALEKDAMDIEKMLPKGFGEGLQKQNEINRQQVDDANRARELLAKPDSAMDRIFKKLDAVQNIDIGPNAGGFQNRDDLRREARQALGIRDLAGDRQQRLAEIQRALAGGLINENEARQGIRGIAPPSPQTAAASAMAFGSDSLFSAMNRFRAGSQTDQWVKQTAENMKKAVDELKKLNKQPALNVKVVQF